MDEQMASQKNEIEFYLKDYDEEIEIIKGYTQLVSEILKEPPRTKEVIDLVQEEEIRINNL